MLTRIRSAVTRNGKGTEAVRWVQDVAAHQNSRDTNLHAEVYREVFGDTSRIHYLTRHADLAAYERWLADSSTDPELQRIIAKGPEVIVDGSYRDLLLRSAD